MDNKAAILLAFIAGVVVAPAIYKAIMQPDAGKPATTPLPAKRTYQKAPMPAMVSGWSRAYDGAIRRSMTLGYGYTNRPV